MGKVIQIEVPEEVEVVMGADPTIKFVIEKMVEEKVRDYVLMMLTMDKLTEGSKLTEEDILELEREIKRSIRERIEDEIGR